MSRQSVIKLIESAEDNSSLRNQLYSAKDPDTIIEIATKRGYEFNEEELIAVMQEKQLSFVADEELSEEQLEAVVGGKTNVTVKKNTPDEHIHKSTTSYNTYD